MLRSVLNGALVLLALATVALAGNKMDSVTTPSCSSGSRLVGNSALSQNGVVAIPDGKYLGQPFQITVTTTLSDVLLMMKGGSNNGGSFTPTIYRSLGNGLPDQNNKVYERAYDVPPQQASTPTWFRLTGFAPPQLTPGRYWLFIASHSGSGYSWAYTSSTDSAAALGIPSPFPLLGNCVACSNTAYSSNYMMLDICGSGGTTAVMTTAVGTTAVGTTAVQTTAVGTTAVQTTAIGTTAVQTTAIQTTAVQTTAVGTTAVGTTAVGTTGPTVGCLVTRKIFDANANGQLDAGEPEMPNFPVEIKTPAGATVGIYGSGETVYLPPGTYYVCDTKPTTYNWYSTSNLAGAITCRVVTITLSPTCASVNLFCICTGPNPAAVSGNPANYWTKAAGQSTITESDLQLLRSHNLRTATMAHWDPTVAADLIPFYNNAATNSPHYYLSAQLAIADLLVAHGVNSSNPVLVAGNVAAALGSVSPFVTLQQLRDMAEHLLLNPASSGPGNQLAIALAFVKPNMNENFASPTPCYHNTVSSNTVAAIGDAADMNGGALENAGSAATIPSAIGAVALVAVVAAVAAAVVIRRRHRLSRTVSHADLPTVGAGDVEVECHVVPVRRNSDVATVHQRLDVLRSEIRRRSSVSEATPTPADAELSTHE